jgi:hypothetical protein
MLGKLAISILALLVFAAGSALSAGASKFESIVLQASSGRYYSQLNSDSVQVISFLACEGEETVHLTVRLREAPVTAELLASAEYQADSMMVYGNVLMLKIKFRDVLASRFLKLAFSIDSLLETVDIEPYTQAFVEFRPGPVRLAIGEQKEFALHSSMPNNIFPSRRWEEGVNYDYFISVRNGQAYLSLLPKVLGLSDAEFVINLRSPIEIGGNKERQLSFSHTFMVEKSNLVFLNFENPDFILDHISKTEGIKCLVDNNARLKEGHTYRITDSETEEGVLIAELYIHKKLGRDRTEGRLRLFNYHQRSGGYLYIKDVENAVFITNFTVRPQTDVRNVFTMRSDGIWRAENTVSPGERLQVKLEGSSLMGEKIHFSSGISASLDSLISDDSHLVFNIEVPIGVSTKKIEIYKQATATGRFLEVTEHQLPRQFDFVKIDYGHGPKSISSIGKPVLWNKSLEQLIIELDPDIIDSKGQLYGKQYITVRISLYDKNKKLLETADIPAICACPGTQSPRHGFYGQFDCSPLRIDLNGYLHQHTSNLDDWASVQVEVMHQPQQYYLPIERQKVEIILRRKFNYDLDLSFPAGLLTKEFGPSSSNLTNFSGISLAMVAQISFYQKNKIAKYRPYKLGVGFLAFNMFSLTAEVEERDLGLVILGSVYPSTKDRRLSFPLFLGAGYFLSKERLFLLLGPGIRISI